MQGHLRIIALAVLALLVGCSGGSPRGKSDSGGGNTLDRGARSGVEIPESRLEEIGFRTLWKNPTGGPIVQAYCEAGNIYVVRPGNDHPFVLEKLDGESGLSVWVYPLREKLAFPPRAYSYPNELRAMNPDELYVIQQDELICLDDRYGAKNFGVDLGFPASTAATPSQDHVYVGSWNRRMYAISKQSQLEQWSYITDDSVTAPAAVGDANVYFGSEDHLIYSLSRGGGYIPGRSWTLSTGGRISAEPLVYGDRVFVGSWDYKLYCIEDVGAEAYVRWTFPSGAPIVRQPFAFRDWIFTINQETKSDGSFVWSLGSVGARLGDLRWESEGLTEVLAADSFHCYGLDRDGNIRAMRLETGEIDWVLETDDFDQVLGQDARLGADKAWWGRMFLVSRDGVVQAIRPRR